MLSFDQARLPAPPPDKYGWPWDSQGSEPAQRMKDGRNWPKISIVTPSYNQGQYLEETIRSVLLQGYPDLEYIIMDGGSADRSVQIIRKYEPWLTFWNSATDDGQADAIGKGFEHATGEILAWINSDDYYEADAFLRVARLFAAQHDLVFANGDVNLVGEESQRIRRLFAMRPSFFFAANYGQHGWPQQGCFWRKLAYEQVGGIDPDLQFCMDKDLFIRLVKSGRSQRIPGPPLANFRTHAQSKTTGMDEVGRLETAAIIKKYGRPPWVSHQRVMHGLWWIYRKQAATRLRLNRYFGWEY